MVGTRRAAWRVLSSIQKKEMAKGNKENFNKVKIYKGIIEDELKQNCQEILELLDDHLLPNSTTSEAKVFFHKMKADYHRYIAEFEKAELRDKAKQKAKQAYEDATNMARNSLSSTHPMKLGLALNHSVFCYEILGSPEQACKMARNAFDEAIADLDNVQDSYYKDATLIMQLLRDNLLLWTVEQAEDEAIAGPGNK